MVERKVRYEMLSLFMAIALKIPGGKKGGDEALSSEEENVFLKRYVESLKNELGLFICKHIGHFYNVLGWFSVFCWQK